MKRKQLIDEGSPDNFIEFNFQLKSLGRAKKVYAPRECMIVTLGAFAL
jgi:hypothetical protein